MNKIIIVKQLRLPEDLLDTVCSYIFQTNAASIQRNQHKYNHVLSAFKCLRKEQMISWGPNIVTTCNIYIILPVSKQLIIANICTTCGNYVKKMEKHKAFLCQCSILKN